MPSSESEHGAVIELLAVGHVYGEGTPWARRALNNVDLQLSASERVLIVGSNGSGKSTLAWILSGLIEPSQGTATLDGVPIVDRRSDVGLLVQHTRLQLLRPTVGEELAAFDADRGHQLAALYDMGFELVDLQRRIDDLSIGQQRRVGLAAQLARRPRLLVLDEPMAGLDRSGRSALITAVAALPAETIVVTVTHDLEESAALGDRVVELGQGQLVADRQAT